LFSLAVAVPIQSGVPLISNFYSIIATKQILKVTSITSDAKLDIFVHYNELPGKDKVHFCAYSGPTVIVMHYDEILLRLHENDLLENFVQQQITFGQVLISIILIKFNMDYDILYCVP